MSFLAVTILACAAIPLIHADADDSSATYIPRGLEGNYRVYTDAPNNSQTSIVDPAKVTIADKPFLRGKSIDASGSTRYIAVSHIVELVSMDEAKHPD